MYMRFVSFRLIGSVIFERKSSAKWIPTIRFIALTGDRSWCCGGIRIEEVRRSQIKPQESWEIKIPVGEFKLEVCEWQEI
jgi:hypothetical protein